MNQGSRKGKEEAERTEDRGGGVLSEEIRKTQIPVSAL